ncbi:MAG: hypothetical protein CR986_06905 [Ignavibacteriae bacterium]|nr:MAG: hypothetical protein CR986_06905 [Ignavibacteriota bacterium]
MILIDAHIHIHDCYNLNEFFRLAKTNFLNAAKKNNYSSYASVLCLTESQNIDYFGKLAKKANDKIGVWQIGLTNSKNTILLNDDSGFELYLVAGRQIVTREKLEVLAIGLNQGYEDGKPITEVINFVNKNNSIPIIPWGVGKWSGARGEIVKNLIENKKLKFYLGDNGNRPFFWDKDKLFDLGLKNKIFNLPGSDPLPFDNEINKPGGFGFFLDAGIDKNKPFESIYDLIITSDQQFSTYGKLESLFNFFKNQISMQVVKRMRK